MTNSRPGSFPALLLPKKDFASSRSGKGTRGVARSFAVEERNHYHHVVYSSMFPFQLIIRCCFIKSKQSK